MARKPQTNPQLDMTPMIDVVFELIIFFVVTLTEVQKKDETIELEDGKHGVVLTPEELPPRHMQIDIAKDGRVSMGNVDMPPGEILRRVKEKREKHNWGDFPILIRADFATEHKHVHRVMDECTKGGIWKLSFMAVHEDKTNERKRLKRRRGN